MVLDELGQSYKVALDEIIEEAKKFEDLWKHDLSIRIPIVFAVIEQDESLTLDLRRVGNTFLFNGDFDSEEAARYLRGRTPNGRFYPEGWKGWFYEELKKPFGEYLAEKEIKRRLEQTL